MSKSKTVVKPTCCQVKLGNHHESCVVGQLLTASREAEIEIERLMKKIEGPSLHSSCVVERLRIALRRFEPVVKNKP